MRIVFQHKASEALTIVTDAERINFSNDEYFIVACPDSVGYFPRAAYRFLGIDWNNLL